MAKQKGLGLVGEGVERKAIKELDTAAEAYVDARDKRMAKSKVEKAAKVALIEAMKKHSVNVYRLDDTDPPQVVTLSTKDGVKVEQIGEPPEDGEDGEDLN